MKIPPQRQLKSPSGLAQFLHAPQGAHSFTVKPLQVHDSMGDLMKRTLLLTLALSFVTGAAFSAYYDDVRLGDPEYGGTGCPAGTAGVAISPDAKSLSMLFDQFVVESGGTTGKQLDRKTCNIAVPVHVPQGYSISIFQIDYRGFNSLPYGGYSRFNVEYFFAGTQGPSYQHTFNGALESQYLLRNTVAAPSVVWSPCGQSVILRANTGMLTHTNAQNDATYSTVDSVDVASGLLFNLNWKTCP